MTESLTEHQVAELERLRDRVADLDFLERISLPSAQREVQFQREGKERWRNRAMAAEAEVSRLSRAFADIQAVLASRNGGRTDGAVLQQIAGIVTRAEGGAS